jgi:hypothetical protein
MTKGISLHIGLNRVDPAAYEGWDGELAACEFDAKDMEAIAKKKKFTTQRLLTADATTGAVTAAITAAAKKLKKGDMFLLTYSGHGGQVRDTNRDEKDRYDETWVLHDRQLVDDELYELYGGFKAGVRILVLSDSCHSGTVVRDIPAFIAGGPRIRAMPRTVGEKVERAHAAMYRAIQDTHTAAESAKIGAHVLLISGCQDNQESRDGDRNGLFTETLRGVWRSGKFSGTYRRFRDQIVARMPADQTPNYFTAGTPNSKFEAQTPFTV